MSATMETAMEPLLRFGPAGSPNIDAGLPSAWNTRGNFPIPTHAHLPTELVLTRTHPPTAPFGCLRTISATELGRDTRDTISRYDIWQAFMVLKGMCVRYGRTGRVTGLGTGRKMQLDAISLVRGGEGFAWGVRGVLGLREVWSYGSGVIVG